jgi:hypothetical protein
MSFCVLILLEPVGFADCVSVEWCIWSGAATKNRQCDSHEESGEDAQETAVCSEAVPRDEGPDQAAGEDEQNGANTVTNQAIGQPTEQSCPPNQQPTS